MKSRQPSGRRWSTAVSLPAPFFPFGEGFTPPPYTFPWTWTGRPARRQRVFARPNWLQECLGEPQMASKMAQDSARWRPICSNAQTRIQAAKEPAKEAAKRPKSFKDLKLSMLFCFLGFLLPMAFGGLEMAPRWPKRAPRGVQESSQTVPRAPKSAPRASQEAPRRPHERP